MFKEFYLVYDQYRIHWFMNKEKADTRNLQAIKRKLEKNPKLIAEEISLKEETLQKIKRLLTGPSFAIITMIRKENPNVKEILF